MSDSHRPQQERIESTDDRNAIGAELQECVVCGVIGLPERIEAHDCRLTDATTRPATNNTQQTYGDSQ